MSQWEKNPKQQFEKELSSLIETALDNEISPAVIEDELQRQAQNARQERVVYNTITYECPAQDCSKSHTMKIDISELKCDVCGHMLNYNRGKVEDGKGLEVFICPEDRDYHTVRVHPVDLNEITCDIHNKRYDMLGIEKTGEDM